MNSSINVSDLAPLHEDHLDLRKNPFKVEEDDAIQEKPTLEEPDDESEWMPLPSDYEEDDMDHTQN